ncbi:MAG: TPM domain-containing protein [Candidatus Aminicenantes bacterium]|nr:TPM domain-containing protein [Candidatus Aminicenantes bacterium]
MKLSRSVLLLSLAAALLLGGAPAFGATPRPAAEIKIPASPDRWATDKAGFLSPAALRGLDAGLEAWERSSGHQFLVYIDRTTGGYPIEEYAVKAFQAWRVGRKGLDDGVVLFVMADDKKIRIEVGYGVEDKITDLRASRIINDILVPGIQAGDPDGAVRRAVDEVQALVSGTAAGSGAADAGVSATGRKSSLNGTEIGLLVIGIIIFLIILITNPSFAIWLLINLLSGGRGGGGGGGGGFGGGGGRSGGGGASGGW